MITRMPSGSGHLTQALREIQRTLRRQRIAPGPNMRLSIGPNGTQIKPVAAAGQAAPKSTGIVAVFL